MKMTVIVGVACVLCSCGLPAEESGGFKIADDFFEYTFGEKGTNALKCVKTEDATIYDLNNFVQAECWNKYVKRKLSDGGKLDDGDAALIRFCLNAKINMVESLVCIIVGDMIGPDAFEKACNSALSEYEKNDAASMIYTNYITQERLIAFAKSNSGIRAPMKQWACMFNNMTSDAVLQVLENVKHASGSVKNPTIAACVCETWFDYLINAYREQINAYWERINVYRERINSYRNQRTQTDKMFQTTMSKAALITNQGKDIGERWKIAHERIKRFPSELVDMQGELKKSIKNGSLDSRSVRLVDEILSEVANRSEYAVRMCDYVVYDLPLCILSYRALGKLKGCKSIIDDEDRMKVVAADYADSICGTEMLKGIRTRYAASCYTEVVKFLKSELGWFTQGAFREFVNETKLYNITLRTDENGKQDNVLEKW